MKLKSVKVKAQKRDVLVEKNPQTIEGVLYDEQSQGSEGIEFF